MAETYQAFHRRSIEQPEAFWAEQAELIDWHKPFEQVLRFDNPPFRDWFVGGETNLCHNAVDRHLKERADQNALIFVSTETDTEKTYTFAELHREVSRFAACLQDLGVGKGDRVLIYMPMIPEAIFAMLATVRLGAIHSVVFGGFAAHSLATRVDDAQPKVMVTADGGMRGGKIIPYKHLVDDALAASMKHIYCGNPGEAYFSTSDIGWVVGHSYIVYGPLIGGMATVVYEGLPIRPDPGIWWQIVEKYKVTVMFSAPTAVRVLKKQDPAWLKKYDISTLRYLFLAGEPLDEPTAQWISDALNVPIIDNYWQTETGWPMLTAMPGVENTPVKFGSPSFPAYGYNLKLLDEVSGEEVGPGEKGVVAVLPPLPPGCLSTVWGQDDRFVNTYFKGFKDKLVYSSFDWGLKDEDGYYFILGRTDDVINVAGHRLGTREIEEAVNTHNSIAECAVVGVADQLKGQVPMAFAVVKDPAQLADETLRASLAKEVIATVSKELGAIANPSQVHFVTQLPKTRSGKVLRRSIQAIAEGRDPGDLTTLDDPSGLEQVKQAVTGQS